VTIRDALVSRTNQLAAEDDLLYHVGPGTIADDYSPSKDPRFYDRYWNVWHDDTGDLMLAVGGSFYPRLGRAESYAIVNLRGEHRSVRAFRPLGRDRADLANGPLRPTIVEGLRRWHHVLDAGDWGFSYDLAFADSHRQEYAAAWGREVAEEERHVTAGFEGFGTVEGWVQVGDERIEWGPGMAHGTRDRHWGIGRGVGGPALNGGRVARGGWTGGIWIDLGDVGLWGKKVLYPFDDPHPRAAWVRDVQRRLRFEEDTHVFTEGLVDLVFDDGSVRHLHLERLGDQTAYMRCGFYGGTPEAGLAHGEYDGPPRVEWDHYDVTDPKVRMALRGLDEHHCRVLETLPDGRSTVTTGILQPLDPDAYEACAAGKPGWSFW
jgi:hypothetical protein